MEADLNGRIVRVPAKGLELKGTKIPDFLMEILEVGGLVPYLRRRFHAQDSPNSR